ncbi:hypothetical protein [Halogeometricum luteum]|uniref:Uncharacterized protein n=1 Tax=Halogeometricum luteum TaxID=2950537 RepID=A0ABU2G2A3_9EURY|nr:hypothetical protein [Halogeometricum sp. S3BR5-2]MDS0294915.1 hypothetical protein [Halogeometricum sp. S3BR5-2]
MPIDNRPYYVGRACGPDDHEFAETADGERYCTQCEFTYDSLVRVLGQSL